MSLDPRIVDLLHREFETIRAVRERPLRRSCAQIREQGGSGSRLILQLDSRVAEEYRERASQFLIKTLDRLRDLRQAWTEPLRAEMQAFLQSELVTDGNWLIELRDSMVGERQKQQGTGEITSAQDIARRLIEEDLTFQVLREERRRLPISDLLSPPRYQAVWRHFDAATAAFQQTPALTTETARESVFAIEALARLVVGKPSATLGDALQSFRVRTDDAGRHLIGLIERIWHFTNSAPSTRHGGGSGDDVSPPEAQFVLGVTEDSLRFLLALDIGTQSAG